MRKGIAILLMIAARAAAQSSEPVAFEVASIKQSPPPDGRGMRMGCSGGPGSKDPGRITCTNFNLANMVSMAYRLSGYQLVGLTSADQNRFEITAKIPEGTTREQIPLMWQSLLADRFKLVIHHEKKEIAGYELVVAKGGLKVKESVDALPPPPDAAPPTPRPPQEGPPKFKMDKDGFPELPPGSGPSMIMMNGRARWRASKAPISQVATMIAGQLAQPVTDATGLTGKYDFVLSWAPEQSGGARLAQVSGPPDGGAPLTSQPESDGLPTLFSALQSQLGLRLEQKKVQIDLVVVDHVEKTPTEN